MKAAVIHAFDQPPRFGDFVAPAPNEGELLIHVRAAALSNLVKAQSAGRHYSSPKQPPFIPGVDGVGLTPAGERVYFFGPRAPFGAMAEQTVVPASQTLVLPAGIDDITAAALGNPGLATWGALFGRAHLQPGERVLINGATGVSGQQAVQVARYLGAAHITATGRNAATLEKLKSLGADETISLDQPEDALKAAFTRALRPSETGEQGTNVILDYLWGHSAELLLAVAGGHGAAAGEPRIRFVQIGSIAGNEIALSAEWLRSSGVELLGSGLGSLSAKAMFHALRAMYDAYGKADFAIDTEAIPLTDVESTWGRSESGRRMVYTI